MDLTSDDSLLEDRSDSCRLEDNGLAGLRM